MACLSYSSIAISKPKAIALSFATLTNNPSSSSSSSSPREIKANPKPKTGTRQRRRRQQRKPQAPSIIQIERAIGAGSFRDKDSSDLEEQKRRTVFDGLLPLTAGSKHESEIEKKLRETGEFIGSKTEAAFRSSGKTILLVVLQWFLPIWTLSLLVASGAIKLPFNIPQIDDLIM